MKKMMYFAGLISCMAMGLGWTLNILGLSGGDMLTGSIATYGFVGFALLFLPLASIESFRTNLKMATRDKLRITLGLVCALLMGASVLLKILNVNGSSQLLFTGALLFVFGFLPLLFLNVYNRIKASMTGIDRARIIVGLLSGFFAGIGVLFKIFHLTGAVEVILLGAIIFFFGFLPLMFFNMYKKSVA